MISCHTYVYIFFRICLFFIFYIMLYTCVTNNKVWVYLSDGVCGRTATVPRRAAGDTDADVWNAYKSWVKARRAFQLYQTRNVHDLYLVAVLSVQRKAALQLGRSMNGVRLLLKYLQYFTVFYSVRSPDVVSGKDPGYEETGAQRVWNFVCQFSPIYGNWQKRGHVTLRPPPLCIRACMV